VQALVEPWWPLETASQNPSTEQLVNVMHKYAKGDAVDFDDEEGAESWPLVGEVRLGLWRRPDTVVRAQPRRRHQELGVHLELQPEERRPPDPAATGVLGCGFVRG
jgi:hypothetical protein